MAANGSSATTSCRRCRGGWLKSCIARSERTSPITRWRRPWWSIAFAFVFATARPLVGATGALVAVLIIDGMHYFQYTAVKFNHDVIQLPFWALAGYAFHAALKRGRLGHWFLLGVAFGGALWAKYFVVVLAAPYALFMLFDRASAARLGARRGRGLRSLLRSLVASPHVVWLFHTDFLPFAYAEHRAAPARGWFDHVLHPALFAGEPDLLLAAVAVHRGGAVVWPATTKLSPSPPLPLKGEANGSTPSTAAS